ncbi:rod shape-determining protein RodA [Acidihalobacter prosperus]|uniref:Peptidoglycan glycosyltransferase MrdB n=1 Tax=Acidihalobacter prosperus TaxID=160660 RepID=A0A1A6C681_9GAMM|nr:rod shape-determining protein RodA [Acidihalobacter prosperus]OBS10040.1 rod shape-determining protein RodA [Acidihalobacter prosperus]
METLYYQGARSQLLRARGLAILSRLRLDWPLVTGILAIFSVGELVLYSASGQDIATVWHQGGKFAVAFVIMIGIAQVSPQQWRRLSPYAYLFAVLMLIAVLGLGETALGARRWLDLGPVRLQPSEFMKLALPLALAYLFSRRPLPLNLPHLLGALLLIAIPVALIAKEPDLGTAMLIVITGLVVIFLAGVPYRYLLVGALVVAALVPVIWHFMHAYQKARILTFLDPERAPLGAGYHIIQSTIAIGSSGLYGLGWLHAPQAQLGFLPESRTDFIFAVFGEEFGLAGSVALLTAYAFIILRGLYIAWRASDNFSRLLAGTLSLTFAMYVFINVGMTMGLLPVVGVPLPFMSYGGTSLVTMAAAMGLLQSIARHRPLIR